MIVYVAPSHGGQHWHRDEDCGYFQGNVERVRQEDAEADPSLRPCSVCGYEVPTLS